MKGTFGQISTIKYKVKSQIGNLNRKINATFQ